MHSGAARKYLLTPFPSPAEYFATRLAEWRYEDAKHGAAYILGELGEPSCASICSAGTFQHLEIEQGRPPEPAGQLGKVIWSCTIRYLQDYENKLVYTLGRLKAFGALWGLEVSEKQLGIWRIHLIMGSLHGQYRSADAMFFRDAPALLLERIRDSLRDIFGVAPADQEDGLKRVRAKACCSMFHH